MESKHLPRRMHILRAHAWIAVCGVALVASMSAWAASSTPPNENSLDEVLVEATRAKLSDMRREMVRLEEKFYGQYNKLNPNDKFDVYCADEARTGTAIRRRYCRPVFESEAMTEEARGYIEMLQRIMPVPPSGGQAEPATADGPPPPAIMAIEAQRPAFRSNMRAVTEKHPELVAILKERSDLAEKYEETRKEVFGNKQVPGEMPQATTTPPWRDPPAKYHTQQAVEPELLD